MLNWISGYSPQGSSNNGVTVIFDGKEEFFGSHQSGSIKVIFSKGESADDLIKKMVEQYPFKKNVVVVSNDKDITLYVRALGAKVLSVKEFTVSLSKKPATPVKKGSSSSKYISLTDQAKINKEFERIWIKENPKKKEI